MPQEACRGRHLSGQEEPERQAFKEPLGVPGAPRLPPVLVPQPRDCIQIFVFARDVSVLVVPFHECREQHKCNHCDLVTPCWELPGHPQLCMPGQ